MIGFSANDTQYIQFAVKQVPVWDETNTSISDCHYIHYLIKKWIL